MKIELHENKVLFNNGLTKQEIHRKMMGVTEWFRAAMDKLLTEEQKSIL